MKITISLEEKYLEGFLKQNKLLKEVIENFLKYKGCSVHICTQDYAIDCKKRRKHFLLVL